MTDLGADRWAYPCFSLGRCYSERAFLHFYPYTSHIIEKERERAKREREREVDNEGHRERERDQRVRESEREEGRGGVWDIESEGARERERERTGEDKMQARIQPRIKIYKFFFVPLDNCYNHKFYPKTPDLTHIRHRPVVLYWSQTWIIPKQGKN